MLCQVFRLPASSRRLWKPCGRTINLLLQALEDRTAPATFTVMNMNDAGTGSLRDAITKANALAGADAIDFDPSLFLNGPRTISLLSALPSITDSIAITGPTLANGSQQLTVQRSSIATAQFGIIDVSGPASMTVNLSNFATSGGNVYGLGGGVNDNSNATLNLSNMVVSNNYSGFFGAGVFAAAATVSLVSCMVANNVSDYGGGLAIGPGGSLSLTACTVSGNSAVIAAMNTVGNGGGIYGYPNTTVTVTNCTISGNSAYNGGGIEVHTGSGSTLTIVGSTISGNTSSLGGGGLYLRGAYTPAAVTLKNSTVWANHSGYGAGIRLRTFTGTLEVDNTTISANTALSASHQGMGGGIQFIMPSDNPAQTATILLQSAIVGGNTAFGGQPDMSIASSSAVIVTANYSLIGVADVGFTLSSGSANNRTGTAAHPLDPHLTPLGDNGGPTMTGAPLPGSPAIDAGANPAGLTTDQVGNPRALGAGPDIGAVEHPPGIPMQVTVSLPPWLIAPTSASYQFAVAYYDDTAIDVGSLAGSNILVTGPTVPAPTVQLVGVDVSSNGSPRTATYEVLPASGSWTAADVGTYTLSLQAGQVLNTSGVSVPPDTLGSFRVGTPVNYTVTTLADAGTGSLREAINQGDAIAPVPEIITFDPSLFASGPGVIVLQSALPIISNDVSISGPALANGHPVVTIKRDSSSPIAFTVFNVSGSGSMTVSLNNMVVSGGWTASSTGGGIQDSGAALALTNMVVTGNTAGNNGGGVFVVPGSLTMTNCSVTDNTAGRLGGGIALGSSATLSLSNTTISGNIASWGGGAMYAAPNAIATLTDCTIAGNSLGIGPSTAGGGVCAIGGQLEITDSTIHDNTAVYQSQPSRAEGGGIYVGSSERFTLTNSRIADNSTSGSGGGLYFASAGAVTLTNDTIVGNTALSGGGVAAGSGGALTILGTTVAGNSASSDGGGLLLTTAIPTITNSTIAGNTAATGGGIELAAVAGTSTIRNSTIAANTATTTSPNDGQGGGGVAITSRSSSVPSADVLVQSTIVAGNFAANGRPDLAALSTPGLVLVADNCLIGSADTGFTLSSGSADNLTGTVAAPLNPMLAPLGSYGGPTETLALLPTSPALDAGSNPANLEIDQRGSARVVGPGADIGAYEYQPITIAGVQVNDGSAERSEVWSITVTFSGAVSFAAGDAAAAFQLQHVQDATNINNLAAAVSTNDAGATVVTLTFTTAGNSTADIDPISARNGGMASLADGRYQLSVFGSAISDAGLGWALDGDGDGTPGGNYVSPADTLGGGPGQLHLYRLFGDANGDGIVDQLDLGLFRSSFNAGVGNPFYLSFLDADNSGAVDQIDLGQFRSRFNLNVF